MDISHITDRIPNNIVLIIKITEGKATIDNREVDSITEAITREVEVIFRMTTDKIPGAEVTEEAAAMTKIRITTDLTTSKVGVVVPSVDHGEPVGTTPEDMDLPHQVLGIHNIKQYHNTGIFVVFAIVEDTMTISVIPSNTCFMLCNGKAANKWHNKTLIMTMLTKPINQLFRTGIPQP